MDADALELRLAARLNAEANTRVGAVRAPVAELRQAGRRRLRAGRIRLALAAAAVLAACAGVTVQVTEPPARPAAPLAVLTAHPGPPSPTPVADDRSTGFCPASPAPGSAAPTAEVPNPGAALRKAMAQVGELGRTYFPDRYAGVCADSRTLYVYRVPGGDLDSASRLSVTDPTVLLRFVDAPYSRAELTELIDRIAKDRPYWEGRGVLLSGMAFAPDCAGLVVTTAQAATVREEVRARYGPRILRVDPQ
ncbi:hypothetical protein [Kitasatospora sp. NPDC002040]|uniref:hypothetical protein n=1 Tax=Kitasatospora sp. NPDC002040 TaxID=3154661 RepID=UPI003333DF4C